MDLLENFPSTATLVHIALLFYCLGLMIRDELWLRLLILIGTGFYLAYYYLHPEVPLWDAMLASSAIGTINLVLIVIILRERTLLAMSPEEAALYRHFGIFSPGQFRRLMRLGHWQTIEGETRMTSEGQLPDRLWFVTNGQIRIDKHGASLLMDCMKFIGEIAYLTNGPATATTFAEQGARVISWDRHALKSASLRHPAFGHALTALLSHDLSRKVALSTPKSAEMPGGHP